MYVISYHIHLSSFNKGVTVFLKRILEVRQCLQIRLKGHVFDGLKNGIMMHCSSHLKLNVIMNANIYFLFY